MLHASISAPGRLSPVLYFFISGKRPIFATAAPRDKPRPLSHSRGNGRRAGWRYDRFYSRAFFFRACARFSAGFSALFESGKFDIWHVCSLHSRWKFRAVSEKGEDALNRTFLFFVRVFCLTFLLFRIMEDFFYEFF